MEKVLDEYVADIVERAKYWLSARRMYFTLEKKWKRNLRKLWFPSRMIGQDAGRGLSVMSVKNTGHPMGSVR